MDANFQKLNKKFELDNDVKFNFDVDNLRKDFAIENMQIADEDIGLLKAKKFKAYFNFACIALAIISVGYLFTCIYAVDKGMGILGFLKLMH